eukprot:gene6716-7425_t
MGSSCSCVSAKKVVTSSHPAALCIPPQETVAATSCPANIDLSEETEAQVHPRKRCSLKAEVEEKNKKDLLCHPAEDEAVEGQGELVVAVAPYSAPPIASMPSSLTMQSFQTVAAEYSPPQQPLLLDHLLPRSHIIAENPKARAMFLQFLRDGSWIEHLFSRRQEHYVNLTSQHGRSSFFREISSVRLHQYIVPSPKSGARRTLSEEEELASTMMMLIKKLKVKDLSALAEPRDDREVLQEVMGAEGLHAAVIAAGLAVFIRSAEYRTAQAQNWSVEASHPAYQVHSASFYHKTTARTRADPFLHVKKLFSSELVSLTDAAIEQILLSESWAQSLQNVLDKLPFSCCISDLRAGENREFPLGYINGAYTTLTGYNAEEALGRSCRRMQCEKTEPRQLDIIREALRRCEACKVGLTNRTKEGRYFVNFLSLRPVLDRTRGVCTFVMGVQYDIDSEDSKVQDLQLIDTILLIFSQALC